MNRALSKSDHVPTDEADVLGGNSLNLPFLALPRGSKLGSLSGC